MDRQLTTDRCEALPPGHRRSLLESGAESGAVGAEMTTDDLRLLRIVSAWSRLPEAIRLEMVTGLDAAE